MLFNCGTEMYEAWILEINSGNKLNEWARRNTQFNARLPQMECYAECENDTDFIVHVEKLPGICTTDFDAELYINGKHIQSYAWPKARTQIDWYSAAGPNGSVSTLRFKAMEACSDPDDQPKDQGSVGVIEIILRPGWQMPAGVGFSRPVAEVPTQTAKPIHAELASTIVPGCDTLPERAARLYTFVPHNASPDAACIRLKFKYATRMKLVALGVVDDPILRYQLKVDKVAKEAGLKLPKRKRDSRSLEEKDVKPTVVDERKSRLIARLEKRIKSLENETKAKAKKAASDSTLTTFIDLTNY